MPLQIRTPEEIFESDPKDIFLIEFADPEGEISPFNGFPYIFENEADEAAYDPDNPPGRAELLAWFALLFINFRQRILKMSVNHL